MKYSLDWRNQYTLKLRRRLGKPAFRDWDVLHQELFGWDPGEGSLSSIHCFAMGHYTYFLDNVKSLTDLIEGLFQLSPFVDDALEVALGMSEADFVDFKLALVYERKAARGEGESKMPEKYLDLVLPNRFPMAILLSEKAAVSLGPALMRIMETELGL